MVQSTECPGGCGLSKHASVVSCVAAISVPTHSFDARDLWGVVLLAELCLLDQRHFYFVALHDICHLGPDTQL